jgi:uncharacterized membrane protein
MPRNAKRAVALVVLALVPALLAACPLCKDAVADGEYPGGGASLGLGFYYSILLMVSAPFVVVGLLFYRIARARKRRNAAVTASSSPASRLVPAPRGARS